MNKITNKKGFTLVELLVVIAIIGVIMAFALPAYNRQVIRSKRTEAHNILMELAAIQERHNAVFLQYATAILGPAETASSLGKAAGSQFDRSPDYIYTIGPANGYTLTATARGTTQTADNPPIFPIDCTVMTINSVGTRTPIGCWQ